MSEQQAAAVKKYAEVAKKCGENFAGNLAKKFREENLRGRENLGEKF